MQSKGLDFLRPIWAMIYSDEIVEHGEYDHLSRAFKCKTKGLNLSESDVSVTYTRYINNYKNTSMEAQPNDKTIDDAVKDGLTPG